MEHWQAIIDDVYEYWSSNNEDVEYINALEYANSIYGDIGELSILLKNYNYQVENGGHRQYFENGYCQNETDYFVDKDYSVPLHRRMIELFEKLGLHETEQGKAVYDVMNRFHVSYEPGYYEEYDETCSHCDGSGYLDENEEDMCLHCRGNGYEKSEEWIEEEININGSLDDDYYEVNQVFLEYFEEVLGKLA